MSRAKGEKLGRRATTNEAFANPPRRLGASTPFSSLSSAGSAGTRKARLDERLAFSTHPEYFRIRRSSGGQVRGQVQPQATDHRLHQDWTACEKWLSGCIILDSLTVQKASSSHAGLLETSPMRLQVIRFSSLVLPVFSTKVLAKSHLSSPLVIV